MLNSGDVVDLDLGLPRGSEAGFPRPAVVVTAQRVLAQNPSVVQVVPLTSTLGKYFAEVTIEPASVNGLTQESAAQCQHIRSVSTARIGATRGRLSPVEFQQIREVLALLLDT